MLAIKGNKEVRILEEEKNNFLDMGYVIYNDKLEEVDRPANSTISEEEFKTKIAEKDNEIAELTKKLSLSEEEVVKANEEIAKLEKQVEDFKEEMKALKPSK